MKKNFKTKGTFYCTRVSSLNFLTCDLLSIDIFKNHNLKTKKEVFIIFLKFELEFKLLYLRERHVIVPRSRIGRIRFDNLKRNQIEERQ